MSRLKVVIFVDWFDPAYKAGGPVQSILSLCTAISHEIDVFVLCGNTDVDGEVLSVSTQTAVQHASGATVYYLGSSQRNRNKYRDLLQEIQPDACYVNGLFSWPFSVLPLLVLNRMGLLERTVIAPRGMLGEGALQLKAFKKKLFLLVLNASGFYRKTSWHSTSFEESKEIRSRIGDKVQVTEIANLPRKIAGRDRKESSDRLNVFFFSRISQKKNLLFAINVLQGMKDCPITFSIFGPIEDQVYWQQCQEAIAQLPSNISVHYRGVLEGKQIEEALTRQDVLFLPTLNENYGHAIVESLFCGCMAILSDKTPWNDLEQAGAGFAIALDAPQKMQEALRMYSGLTEHERALCSQKAIAYISKKVNVTALTQYYLNLFQHAAQNRPQ